MSNKSINNFDLSFSYKKDFLPGKTKIFGLLLFSIVHISFFIYNFEKLATTDFLKFLWAFSILFIIALYYGSLSLYKKISHIIPITIQLLFILGNILIFYLACFYNSESSDIYTRIYFFVVLFFMFIHWAYTIYILKINLKKMKNNNPVWSKNSSTGKWEDDGCMTDAER